MLAPATDWFLPASERPWTTGNEIALVVHGAEYFARLVKLISATDVGDEVCFTDWRGDADEKFTPDGPTVSGLLCDAARRGVQVRGLMWRSHSDRSSFSAQENLELGVQLNRAGGQVLLDERVRRGGSHHQKLVVIRHRGRPQDDTAFVGGVDLCHGRRDDGSHRGDSQQQKMDRRYGSRAPWHDAMLEIRGPAVHDVWASFAERWNDPTPVDHRNPYRRMRQRAADMPRQPEPMAEHIGSPGCVGQQLAQVLRTYPRKNPPFPFAPEGERTIARAYERVFSRAQRLVYIEDQYLWSAVVARALADALRRAPQLQVIAVVPRFPDADGRLTGPPNRLGQLAALRILSDSGGSRFAAYDLENELGTPIYVHAKVCVVDDVWFSCGSDNFNRRSWTHDSEITCAVLDPDGDLPRRVRAQLWSEHLGVGADSDALLDLDRAVELWRSRVGAPGSRVKVHRPNGVSTINRLWAHPMQRLIYDPDGRPLRQRLRRSF